MRYLHTYSMEQSPSWKANRFSASQEIPSIVWNPNVHYHIHEWPPPVPILSHIEARVYVSWPCQFQRRGVVCTSSNHQSGGPPLVVCPGLHIQYIRSHASFLEAVPPFATRGRALPWWQGPLIWVLHAYISVTYSFCRCRRGQMCLSNVGLISWGISCFNFSE
jgi:hypothetical protein